jgi:hypothetical protein
MVFSATFKNISVILDRSSFPTWNMTYFSYLEYGLFFVLGIWPIFRNWNMA